MTAAGRAPLVIGVGNPHRGDDGAGPAVAALVAGAGDPRLAGARVRSVVQLTPELAAEVAEASVVAVVDARVGADPGTVACRPVEAAVPTGRGAPARALTHGFGPGDLVALAGLAYDRVPPVYVVEVGATGFGPGSPLSEPVSTALASAVEAVAAVLAAHAPQAAGGR